MEIKNIELEMKIVSIFFFSENTWKHQEIFKRNLVVTTKYPWQTKRLYNN